MPNMPSKRLNQIVRELSFDKKILTAGSLLMIISAVLPWYQDLDSFRTGDMFLGINGPLYLVGFSLIALAAINLALIYSEFTGIKIPRLPVKKHVFFMFTGIFAFYALILVNSAYFHPKFGINITLKQSQFGMLLAFFSAAMITIGGYLSMKDKGAILQEFREKAEEPLIDVPVQERNPEKIIRKEATERRGMTEVPVKTEPVAQMQMGHAVTDENEHDHREKQNHQTYRMDL